MSRKGNGMSDADADINRAPVENWWLLARTLSQRLSNGLDALRDPLVPPLGLCSPVALR